jgi:AraC family transcriptional regulator
MGRHEHGEWRYCLAIRGSYAGSWGKGYRTRAPFELSLHPANEMHTTAFHTDAACFHIEFTRHWRERLLGDAGIAQQPHEFLRGQPPAIASRLYQEFQRADRCALLVLEGLACELAGWSARDLSGKQAAPPWIYRARDLLHDRFRESLELNEIAAELGVHCVRLARQFKSTFGLTVGDYVRHLRVEFARGEIRSGKPLSNLAVEAGFSDQSHLTRIFKRLTGLTPGQYRMLR